MYKLKFKGVFYVTGFLMSDGIPKQCFSK